MDESSGSRPTNLYSSLTSRMSDCEGCKKRKEYLTTMIGSSNFWVGVVVGVGGVWAYHRFAKK